MEGTLVSVASSRYTYIPVSLSISLNTNANILQKVFKEFDTDETGTFNSFQLRNALNSAGNEAVTSRVEN